MPPQTQQNLMNLDDRPPRSSREARAAARAAKSGGSSHYRRGGLSPELDEYNHFSGPDEPRSPNSDVALQDAILAQAQQQRMVPVGQLSRNAPPPQRRPAPGQNGHPPSRGGPQAVPPSPSKSQPPSYSSSAMDDGSDSRNGSSRGHYRRNPSNAGRRPSESDGPPPSSSAPDLHPSQSPTRSAANMNGRTPQGLSLAPPSQRRPNSPGTLSVDGNAINRLNSPSVMKSVLQPLEQKMQEYDQLMQDAHNQMMQLDEEIRLMQDRRAQAEERFVEAKTKHDEYERQHVGVGRALRGEPEPQPRLPSPEPVQRMVRMESFVDDDDRPMSNQSSHKMKGRSRLRLSLFKN
ncbi:hypothetical protein BGZ63DRAFT_457858 [Mariannaea sp. PMI_226]|nr:hypothetical protein BGZ63DRAFT_457858 [Mariannaea sp. PMI_226]